MDILLLYRLLKKYFKTLKALVLIGVFLLAEKDLKKFNQRTLIRLINKQ